MGRAFEYRRAAKEKRWDKMSKVFPKLGKAITMAAKEAGTDPDTNARLRTAIQNAKAKAEDFVSVLNQKVGKAMKISDNSQAYNPPRPMYEMKAMAMADGGGGSPRETLATGEIELVVNVSVSFVLE